MEVPGIEGTFAITGLNLLSGTDQTNTATMFLPLSISANETENRPKRPRRFRDI